MIYIKELTGEDVDPKMLSEHKIQCLFGTTAFYQKRYDLIVPSCFYKGDVEADLYAIRKSGLVDEIEIKLTKADFKNDAKKTVRFSDKIPDGINGEYNGYNSYDLKKYEALEKGKLTNYFWYLVPEGLLTVDDIPSWAGLMIIQQIRGHYRIKEVRSAKRLHKNKITEKNERKAYEKISYRYWNSITNRLDSILNK